MRFVNRSRLIYHPMSFGHASFGSAWGPVTLPVFKTGARHLCGVVGVFDSHTLPPYISRICKTDEPKPPAYCP